MMIGLEVAPVAPNSRLMATSLGSMESSQSFVPAATSDSQRCQGGHEDVLQMGTGVNYRVYCTNTRKCRPSTGGQGPGSDPESWSGTDPEARLS